jgi:hypothetical protein
MERWKNFVFFPPPPLAIEPKISASKESPPVCVIPQVASLESFPPVARLPSIPRQWNPVEPPLDVVQGIFCKENVTKYIFIPVPKLLFEIFQALLEFIHSCAMLNFCIGPPGTGKFQEVWVG